MKKLLTLLLMMVLVSAARGTEYLTANGDDVSALSLSLDEICTIEVVSNDGTPYLDLLELKGIDKDDLTLLEIRPEAGEDATVTIESRTSYALLAEGPGLAAGVHFIFQFIAQEPGVVEIELWESGGVFPLDSIEITVAEPESTGTVFTYQGRLVEGGNPAHGEYDMEFKIYRSQDADIPFGVVSKENINVDTGIFTVELDFGGGIFDGDARWLEIGTRPGELTDPNAYTFLSPWQKVNPAPYAIHAADADTLDGMDASDFRPAGDIKQFLQDFVVAAGHSVSAGDVVSFLDGYVQKGFIQGDGIAFGPEYVFNPGTTYYSISVAVLSANKFVVAYQDAGNSDYGTCIVGEISGTTITYGSEYVFNAAKTYNTEIAALSSSKFVVAYNDKDNSATGTCIIGEVTGNTIAYGSEYVFIPLVSGLSVAALSSTKFVLAFHQAGTKGWAFIGEVSGTTITGGTQYDFNVQAVSYLSVTILSENKFVVAYRDGVDSGTCIMGDISGTTITYGSKYVFNPAVTSHISVAGLTTNKFIVTYVNQASDHWVGAAVVGGVSDTAITFGSEYVFNYITTSKITLGACSSNKIMIIYTDEDHSFEGTLVSGTVSGNTITYGPKYVFNPDLTDYCSLAFLSSSKFVVSYLDGGNSDYGTAIICDVINDEVVGIAKESKMAGQQVPVIIGGVSDVHSGLTPGEVYFSDSAGDLTDEGTNYRVGLAISSTEILLDTNRSNVDQFFGDMIFANNFRITEGSTFEGLILKNQLGREILAVDEEGILNINGLSFYNTAMQKSGWLIFEDNRGVGLQNIHTGKIYDFVLRERNKSHKQNDLIDLEKAVRDLRAEVKALKTQIQIKK